MLERSGRRRAGSPSAALHPREIRRASSRPVEVAFDGLEIEFDPGARKPWAESIRGAPRVRAAALIYHPFGVMLTQVVRAREQFALANRFSTRSASRSRRCASSNCRDRAIRRSWVRRILDRDGEATVAATAEAVELARERTGKSRRRCQACGSSVCVCEFSARPAQEGGVLADGTVRAAGPQAAALANTPGSISLGSTIFRVA